MKRKKCNDFFHHIISDKQISKHCICKSISSSIINIKSVHIVNHIQAIIKIGSWEVKGDFFKTIF